MINLTTLPDSTPQNQSNADVSFQALNQRLQNLGINLKEAIEMGEDDFDTLMDTKQEELKAQEATLTADKNTSFEPLNAHMAATSDLLQLKIMREIY